MFFTFNTLEVDSNNDKRLIFDSNNIYEEGYYSIYFVDINSKELEDKLKILDMDIMSYIVNDKKYYARNIIDLENQINNDNLNDKLYYEENGIKIDGINVVCQINELIKINNIIDTF